MKILKTSKQRKIERDLQKIDFEIGSETYRKIRAQLFNCPECKRKSILPMGIPAWNGSFYFAECNCRCGCQYRTDILDMNNPFGKHIYLRSHCL